MSLENDIFNNPLEAFPEFIDEAVPQVPSEPAPEPVMVEQKNNRAISRASANYIDPLDTVEEIDLSTLSQPVSEFSFDEDTVKEETISDSSYFEKTNLTIGSIEYEDVAVRKTDDYLDIDDSVPDEAPVIEEVSVDDFLSDTGSVTEEIDLDAFLGDSGFTGSATSSPAGSSTTEEISLDDFGVDFSGIDADAINAFAASSKQEKSDIENAPAIDMELEFDDDFVLETKANPEDDIDFDFEALMAGESIQIPQQASTGDELLDNFDDIFNNIVDETAPSASSSGSEIEFDPSAIEEVSLDDFGLGDGGSSPASTSETAEKVTEQQIVFDEVSDFDDLLSSFSDETHVEVADNRANSSEKAGPHDYNIIVVMEEDADIQAVQMPAPSDLSEEEEDYAISIFADENEAESYRNHSIGHVSSENEPSFSFDSVSTGAVSDTFEDISLDDFGVTFEDETPVEKPEPTEVQSTSEEETAPAEETVITEDPVVTDISSDSPVSEETTIFEDPSETFTECEDTTIDDKKIVELSEDCVYNGDNTEYTPDMIDGNNEEISDTMDSMNEGLLEKIVSELSVLRNEMQNLRNEVQTLKEGGEPAFVEDNAEPAVQEDISAIPEEDIPVPEADPFAAPQEAGGFFSGDDDDETIALSGDELNNILNSADFTQEDGSNFGMEAPEGSVLPEGLSDDFAMEEPSAETEDVPVEETVSTEDFNIEAPAEEEVSIDDFNMEAPVEEPVAEEPAAEDFSMDEPVAEETFEATSFETEEVSIDDFNTDLPSLKEEEISEESVLDETPSEEATTTEDFSLDDFDIPEPEVDENSIANIDIDEPEITETEEETAPAENFSLDDFDIPEPTVEENSIADIDIDEPSSEIPSDEPAAPETEDTDFYANSDSPAISEDDISAIDIQENLEEPVLDDIDFGMDEPQNEEIEIPTGESLIVDSSSTDFLEEDDPTLDEQLTSEKVDYLNEEASVDDLGSLPEIEEPVAVEGMEDSLEVDTLATSEDETPADDVFSSQWDSITEETDEAVPATEPDKEEFVQASTSFDDPVSFDIDEPAAEIPTDEPEFDAISDFEAPAEAAAEEEVTVEEPVVEESAPNADVLDGDIKQEVKSVLKYMDQLLENLPEDKIAEFAQSEHFETYKKLFNELGLV